VDVRSPDEQFPLAILPNAELHLPFSLSAVLVRITNLFLWNEPGIKEFSFCMYYVSR
jgi:hypothetical protein